MGHYIHHVPGRLRIKTPVLKRNERQAAAIKELLQHLTGIDQAEVNVVTGSILIIYDKDAIDSNHILTTLRDAGYTSLEIPLNSQRPTSRGTASKLASTVGKTVFGILVEKAVERSAVSLIAALI